MSPTDSDNTRENVHLIPLNWNEVSQSSSEATEWLREVNATRILAADVVYDPDLVGPLADTLRAALIGSGDPSRYPVGQDWNNDLPFALVSSTVRNPATYQAFLDALHSRGLRWKLSDTPRPIWPNTGEHPLPLFPSTHDPELGGHVEIVCIQLQP